MADFLSWEKLKKYDGLIKTFINNIRTDLVSKIDKKADAHSHPYAGSSTTGGSATSAVKLDTSAGSATQPVYFSGGKPVATTYTLGKSVPSNAVFTDTNTHYASKNVVGSASATSNTTSALTNGNVYLNSVENGAVTSAHKISGSGATTVTSDSSGNIIISSTDNNTTYSAATQSANGLMTAADKKKLDGIAASANAYSHPTSSGNKHIPSGGSSGQILRWSADGTAAWGADNNTTYSAATQSANGLMSAADKKKLDGIATGANAYSLPTASSSTLGGVKTTSTVTSTSGLTACPIISGVPYYKDTNTTYSLSSFGITATSAELNYCDGVTSNIQTQLNNKYGYGSEMGTNSLLIGTGGGWIYNSTNDGNIYFRYKNSASDTDYQWANLQSMMNSINNHMHNFVAKYNNNTINTPANDTTANWGQYGSSFHFYNTLGMINNQPSQYGFLQTYGYADEVYQLWMAQPGGSMYIRGGNASGWGTGWKRLLDSSYLTSSVDVSSNDYVPTAGVTNYLYNQLANKADLGGNANFKALTVNEGINIGPYAHPYIYTDGINVIFRWLNSDWTTYRYMSMEDIFTNTQLGKGILDQGTDLNNITMNGCYMIGGSYTNNPFNWGVLVVFNPNYAYIFQLGVDSNGTLYHRFRNSEGLWTVWKKHTGVVDKT